MNLLAIETSGARGSVALSVGERLLERTIPTPREQTELVLPLVRELLDAGAVELSGLDAIVFGRGPGSFTGLRVAAAVAQGLALASGRPLIGISSMAAVAQQGFAVFGIEAALVCVDARMGEVYHGFYRVRRGIAECEGAEALAAPGRVPVPASSDWSALGTGFEVYESTFAEHSARADRVVADIVPRGCDLIPAARAEAAAGRFIAPAQALPIYLRNADAWRR